MKRTAWWGVAISVLVVGAIAWYFLVLAPALREAPPPSQVLPPPPAAAPPQVEAAPAIRYPIGTEAPAETQGESALPPLDQSDAAVSAALAQLLGKAWPALFVPDRVIRRIVATVDALPRNAPIARVTPVAPVPGLPRTARAGDGLAIAPDNAARYAPHVALLKRVGTPVLVDLYVRFYPLFQKAYEELGYPHGYFNDRLVEAIDDLLAAPEPEAPVPLVQPKVLYRYADPALEARSTGQKIMMRIGRENEQAVKAKLREVRERVVARAAGAPGVAPSGR